MSTTATMMMMMMMMTMMMMMMMMMTTRLTRRRQQVLEAYHSRPHYSHCSQARTAPEMTCGARRSLNGNRLTSTIPARLGRLTKLQYL